jgi:glycerate 2-kinase
MSPIIKNFGSLLNNADSRKNLTARRIALGCLEAALQAANPSKIMSSSMRMKGSKLRIFDQPYDLSRFRRILVVGGGKAAASMAVSLERLLGTKISEGCVNILRGTMPRNGINRIELNEASHPIPDDFGLKGARRMLEILEDVTARDLVICLLSGGGSALMPCPIRGVTLRDKQRTTQLMLRSGATINELNAVRKHLSLFKGGGLAKAAFPASVLTLILSDVVGDPLDTIASGPTSPDPTTFTSAISVLETRSIWELVPKRVRIALNKGVAGEITETPKPGDMVFRRVKNIIVGNNQMVCDSAVREARRMGANGILLTTLLEGEAKEVGIVLSAIARESSRQKRRPGKPVAIIMGGETTVTATGGGRGGRNQEMMLSASIKLKGHDGIAIASLGTDGLDGDTPAAGAIVDGRTFGRAEQIAMKPDRFLENNDSFTFFNRLHDTLITGATGTNLNDVAVAAVV